MPNLSQQRQHPILISLGKAIRMARRKKGLSQENLALLSGIDRSYMGRIERGDNNVAILTLSRISEALGMRLEELMHDANL